ncbi:hypothetical protein L9F63_017188, partial [Diploptera punctata]
FIGPSTDEKRGVNLEIRMINGTSQTILYLWIIYLKLSPLTIVLEDFFVSRLQTKRYEFLSLCSFNLVTYLRTNLLHLTIPYFLITLYML